MPRLEDLPAPDRLEVESTRTRLDDLFQTVLQDMDRSDVTLTFPKPVQFNTYTLDSITAKAAAGIVRQLHQDRLLLIAVNTTFSGPLYKVGQFSFTGQEASAKFISAFFVGNFIARCNSMGSREAREIVQKAINLIVFNDATMKSNGTKRALIEPTNSLVSIFPGNIILRD